MTSRRLVLPLALLTAGAFALAGCSQPAPAPGGATDAQAESENITVVASTNVYGQIAQEIGGDRVDVTSIITSGAQDPHGYEATAQDQLTVSRADVVILNGGGYDGFMEALVGGTDAEVVVAAESSHDWPDGDGDDHSDDDDHADDAHDDDHDHADDGHDGHTHIEGFNEHVWYDPHTIEHVAEEIAEALSDVDPDGASSFEENLAAFTAGIAELETSLDHLKAEYEGTDVFVTEPLPLGLTHAAGLVNVAPEAFTEAVEEGQDVAPATLLQALRLIEDGDVRIVIANAQTGGAETDQIISAAESAGIPVLEFAETLPEGQTYLSWMDANVAALAGAL